MINYYTNTAEDTIDAQEYELYNLIMQYRQSLGLDTIGLSSSLTITAGRHALDTVYNVGAYAGHSWSDAPYDSSDPSTYDTMWSAPERVGTPYTGDGFEITTGFAGSAVTSFEMTPQSALENWQNSPGHNAVITNTGIWATLDFNAIGVGIHQGIAHVWFGREVDPAGAAIVEGTAGNDVFVATIHDDTFSLGTGHDTVVRADASTGTTISVNGGTVTITTGSDVDNYIGTERVEFTNGTIAFDTAGTAGQVYRLYQAAYDRTPDTTGLGHNVDLVDNGLTLSELANAFVNNAEFQARYGVSVDDTAFLTLLYNNVLDRGPDAGGLNGWLSLLQNGMERSAVLIGFSESPENIANVAPDIDFGIWLG